MQVGAVNNLTFKAKGGYDCTCQECRPDLYATHRQDDFDLDPRTLRDQYIKERDDVSPLTALFTVGAGVIALKGGAKAVAYGRRGIAFVGELVSKAFVKTASKVKKSIDYDKQSLKIQKAFEAVKDDRQMNDEKLTKRFTDAVNAILAPKDDKGAYKVDKGGNIVKTLNKFGIYLRPTSIIDHGIAAAAVAYPTMSEAGKRMESDMDKKQFHDGTMKQNNIYEKVAMQVLKEAISEGI